MKIGYILVSQNHKSAIKQEAPDLSSPSCHFLTFPVRLRSTLSTPALFTHLMLISDYKTNAFVRPSRRGAHVVMGPYLCSQTGVGGVTCALAMASFHPPPFPAGPDAPHFQDDEGKRPSGTTAPTFGPSSVLMAASACQWEIASQAGRERCRTAFSWMSPASSGALCLSKTGTRGTHPLSSSAAERQMFFDSIVIQLAVVNCFSLREARGTCQRSVMKTFRVGGCLDGSDRRRSLN